MSFYTDFKVIETEEYLEFLEKAVDSEDRLVVSALLNSSATVTANSLINDGDIGRVSIFKGEEVRSRRIRMKAIPERSSNYWMLFFKVDEKEKTFTLIGIAPAISDYENPKYKGPKSYRK